MYHSDLQSAVFMISLKLTMNMLNSRMQQVQDPLIPVIGELIYQHPETISLGQGVVYYNPPPEALQMIPQFLANEDNHKYKSVQGISPLIEAIKLKLQQDNHIKITDDHAIVVTAGGNMAFMNAILAITNPGDEIILQTPYYFNHEMAIRMASCIPILVETDQNYQLQIDLIKAAITPKTKAIVTISPNNPTGVVYPLESLLEVNQLCQVNHLYHIHDEAYEYFTYNETKHISPGSFPDSSSHTISLYSLSKAFGFASWRIGYMVFPQHLLMAVKKVQDTILICPPVISQYAALGALKAGKSYCQKYLSTLDKNRKIVLEYLSLIQDICTVVNADGAFYFFLKINTEMKSLELAEQLIKQYNVAVIPGNTFGMENGCYLRLAYGALEQKTITEGLDRLVKGLNNLI
jgi:aspartate/methionine/tyrosine aminotransferase